MTIPEGYETLWACCSKRGSSLGFPPESLTPGIWPGAGGQFLTFNLLNPYTMKPLHYSPQHLGYILGVKPLDYFEQKRVDMIKDINTIQMKLGKGALSPKQFDYFWDAPLDTLTQIIFDQVSLLHTH